MWDELSPVPRSSCLGRYHVSPRTEDRHDLSDPAESGADLTLGGDTASVPAVDDAPFNLSMYLDFLPGTD